MGWVGSRTKIWSGSSIVTCSLLCYKGEGLVVRRSQDSRSRKERLEIMSIKDKKVGDVDKESEYGYVFGVSGPGNE